MEGHRRLQKVMELYGSLWKMQECSTGKLGKRKENSPESSMKRESKRLGKRGAVHDITPLLMSFRRQCHCQQQCSSHTRSWGERGRPCSLYSCCRGHGGKDSQYCHVHGIGSGGNTQDNGIPRCCV